MTDEQKQAIWNEACKDTPQAPGWNRHIRYASAIESAAAAPLLERIAELETDRDRLEKYWNEALATHENIAALKSRIAELEAKLAQQAEAQEPVEYQYQSSDGTWHGFIDERHKKNTIEDGRWPIRALFTRPQPAQLTAEDDRRHVICLCPDCIKPKDAPTAVQGEQP